jgi:hypothetical protein
VPRSAELSLGNQGILLSNESNGITTDPGKGVGEGINVAVAVGSGVNVGGMGDGVNVEGAGVEAGAHPLNKTISTTNKKNIDFFMTLSPFDLIAQDCA